MSTQTPIAPAAAPLHPDLHLVFDWEWAEKEQKDICLLTTYTYSEAEGIPESRPSRNYYIGVEKNPRLLPVSFGGNRNFDMNLDLSAVSADDAKKILCTPEKLIQEIRDKQAGKYDADETFQPYSFKSNLTGTNPNAYVRDDDGWQQQIAERGKDRKGFKQPKISGTRRTGSKGWIGDGENGPQAASAREKIYSGSNSGVQTIRIASGLRKDAPWWILDDEKFRQFAQVLATDKDGFRFTSDGEIVSDGRALNQKSLEAARMSAALDYIILDEFYRQGYEDEAIFVEHEQAFVEEKFRQRQTKSVAAVKKRRQRLVQKGNEMFGETRPNVIPISQPRPYARLVKRAYANLVGR